MAEYYRQFISTPGPLILVNPWKKTVIAKLNSYYPEAMRASQAQEEYKNGTLGLSRFAIYGGGSTKQLCVAPLLELTDVNGNFLSFVVCNLLDKKYFVLVVVDNLDALQRLKNFDPKRKKLIDKESV